MASLRGLYNAVINSNTTNLIIAPTQRQSSILFSRIKKFLNTNSRIPEEERFPINEAIVRETRTVIEFENGSELYALPAAEDASNIRGFPAHLIIIDEGAYIKDPAYAAIDPMLAATQGNLMLLGTPAGRTNYFFKAFSDPKEGFSTHHFPSKCNPMITAEYLKQKASTLPDFIFSQEYMGEFVETVGAMFPMSLIERVMLEDCPYREKPIPGFEYYLGYDPARFGGDEAVGIIMERKVFKDRPSTCAVVNTFEPKAKNIADQIRYIMNLNQYWRFRKIITDDTGVGGGLTDPLVDAGLPVEGFTFSIKSKMDAYFHCLKMLEAGELILPQNEKLKKQMSEIKSEQQEGTGFTKIYHPAKTGQDDYPTALVLACWGVKVKAAPLIFAIGRKPFFQQ